MWRSAPRSLRAQCGSTACSRSRATNDMTEETVEERRCKRAWAQANMVVRLRLKRIVSSTNSRDRARIRTDRAVRKSMGDGENRRHGSSFNRVRSSPASSPAQPRLGSVLVLLRPHTARVAIRTACAGSAWTTRVAATGSTASCRLGGTNTTSGATAVIPCLQTGGCSSRAGAAAGGAGRPRGVGGPRGGAPGGGRARLQPGGAAVGLLAHAVHDGEGDEFPPRRVRRHRGLPDYRRGAGLAAQRCGMGP